MVAIPARGFALAAHEVTVGEWMVFVDATHRASASCGTASGGDGSWRDPGFVQTPTHPVVCVTWEDAQDYAGWLSARTGERYHLPTGREWELAARAGSRMTYSWGALASRSRANFGTDRCCAPQARARDRWAYTAPVQSFPVNRFGLFDMAGNVWEWVSDCAAPDCAAHTIRGGSWLYPPDQMQPGHRRSHATPGISVGFRVARDL